MTAPTISLRRAPADDDELHLLIQALFGINIPRVQVCPDHVAPFKAVADAFFGRPPGYAVWYASRGSGKSLALAILGLMKTLVLDVDTTILGGSMTQSQNVATHMSDLLHFKRAPTYALKGGSIAKGVTATQITTSTGHRVRPIPASQTTVRGPHPPLSLLDECLPASTLVDTPQGPRQIDTIIPGDTVWSWSDAGLVEQVVTDARCTGTKSTVTVTLATGLLTCTSNHPVMTSQGWVAAGELTAEDRVLVVPSALDRTRQEHHRHVSGLLASAQDSNQDQVQVQGLPRSVLGNRSQGPGPVSQLCSEDPGSDRRFLSGLRDSDQAARSAVPFVLASSSISGRDDRAHGTGTSDCAQDKSTGQQGRVADGRATRSLRAALRAICSLSGLDSRLRTDRLSGSDRGAWRVLARQAISDRTRSAKTSRLGVRRLPSDLCSDRSDALLVDVIAVSAGPVVPVYNLTVAGEHTYIADGVVVHNCDEMDLAIFDAAMGQAMEQMNTRGEVIGEYIVASSTWQNPDGTFTEIMERARRKGQPIYTWCWRELLEPHGWMSKRFIDQKRNAVSTEMWRTEYELNEPSGSSRAFDLDAIEKYFVPYQQPVDMMVSDNDSWWTWEEPSSSGLYAVGADWAKEKDKTVIACVRYDVNPRRLVYLRRVNRQSYKEMIGGFDRIIDRYNAVGQHDATGLGGVVNDFSTGVQDGTVGGFNFAGRAKRSEMLLGYITDFEAGGYRLPKPGIDVSPENDALREFYKAHRSTTTADVYGNHASVTEPGKHHLPDDIAAMGLAHRAAGRIPQGLAAQGVPVDQTPRRDDAQFHVEPFTDDMNQTVGEVTIVDERYDGMADFSFLVES